MTNHAPAETIQPVAESPAASLADRPGFLVRRLHQIHLALFAEECLPFGVTPVQYSIMSVLRHQPDLDQASLAHEVGVDRTTLANVVARLEGRNLVRRTQGRSDRRLKHVRLSPAGHRLVVRMSDAAQRAHDRTVEPLSPRQRATFLAALRRLVDAGNEYGRAPLRLS